MNYRLTTTLLAFCAVLFGAQPSSAQTLSAADSLYFALRPLEALTALAPVLDAQPNDLAALLSAARAALAAGWIDSNEKTSIPKYREAEAYARRAVTLAPNDAEPHFWLAAAVGRRAQINKTVREAAKLADEVYTVAHRALALDSTHAGAHHVLGQLHYEVLTTPKVLRSIGLRLIGGGRMHFDASWTEAERHLAAAVRLMPDVVAFHVELARLHHHHKRWDAARTELQAALSLPNTHPQDSWFKAEAEKLLKSVNRD